MANQTALNRVTSFIKQKKIDGVLFRKRSSFSWLTGGRDNHIDNVTELGVADLLIFQEKQYCITTKMESDRIRDEELFGLDYAFITPEWYEGHDAAIKKMCEGKIVVSDVPFYGLLYAKDELAALRFSLTEEEISRYYWLSQRAAKAVESTCREIQPGWSEHEIAAHLAFKVMQDGINPQVTLVSTDERVFKYRHPIPTGKRLERYAMIVLCAEKWGLVSNVTRFVHFGPLPKEIEENKQKLAQIDVAMNTATRPGVAIQDIFQIGIEMYAEVGYPDDWRLLHQGGPTGYASREFLATPNVNGIVQVNQTFAWNPAIRGVKSEDTMLVGETENQFLTHTGEWVYMELEQDGVRYLRPDILVR